MKQFILKTFPIPVIYGLLEFRSLWERSARVHYGQSAEDISLQKLTNKIPRGFYVDVGSNHPFKYSNTALLYKKGWHGINIDPNPLTQRLFELFRSRDTNIMCGIGERAEQDFYFFTDSKYNTFSKTRAEELVAAHKSYLVGTEKVRIIPLREILREQGVSHVDFLNIDVEGMDMEVLTSIDWEVLRPRIIAVESWNVDFEHLAENEVYAYLTARGYRLAYYVGYTMLFSLRAP